MHKIETYRKLKEMSQAALGRIVGVSGQHIHLIESGARLPSPELAKKIEAATDGLVTRHQLRPDIWEQHDVGKTGS